MIPVLYRANATDFSTYGIGTLTDTISCVVTEERNGAYECVLKYPITGAHYAEIQRERLIGSCHDALRGHEHLRHGDIGRKRGVLDHRDQGVGKRRKRRP